MARHLSVALEGIELTGRCGVTEEERVAGSRLSIDVRLVPRDIEGLTSDELVDTVDYGQVADLVKAAVQGREYNLIERLATVIADMVFAALPVAEVSVTVRKLNPPVSVPAFAARAEVLRRL